MDSTFATPYLLRPIEYGADLVVHSATKFIGGHGTAMGGVVVESGRFDWSSSGKFPQLSEPNASYHGISFQEAAGSAAFTAYLRAVLLRDTGAALSPFHAFLFLQGLETLSLRVERHVENALRVVNYLNSHPKVERVNHPSLESNPGYELYRRYFPRGGASIFTVEIKGGAGGCQKVYRRTSNFLPSGQCCGCEIPGHSSGFHHTWTDDGRGTFEFRYPWEHSPPFHRYGTH